MTSDGDAEAVTRQLAEFCSGLVYDDLDDNVRDVASKAFVDFLGACYAGTETEAGNRILRYAESFDGAGTTVIGTDIEPVAHIGALANGTTAHALDVDDGHRGASAHPGSAIIPAALAIAERCDAHGSDLITAVVAGYEAMIRTAVAVQTSHRDRHFHATATTGCFGAAAAASHVIGLDARETAHALGLAGTQAGGVFEFMEKGSMAKRFHPGRAAMAGVIAADLAATGFDGPDTIIEGDEGFAEAYSDEYDFSPFANLGDPFAISQIYIKPYPCCRHIHGPIQAIRDIRTEGVEPADVERIEVQTYRSASHHDKTEIETLLDAQMSMPYGVAIALATGEATLDRFDPANADRDDVGRVIERTTVTQTDEMEARYPATRPSITVVETTDGRRFERLVEYPDGAAESPLSMQALIAKFEDLSSGVLDTNERDAILEASLSIGERESVAEFCDFL